MITKVPKWCDCGGLDNGAKLDSSGCLSASEMTTIGAKPFAPGRFTWKFPNALTAAH